MAINVANRPIIQLMISFPLGVVVLGLVAYLFENFEVYDDFISVMI